MQNFLIYITVANLIPMKNLSTDQINYFLTIQYRNISQNKISNICDRSQILGIGPNLLEM